MNHSTTLKILTLLTQAFILVGAGHGAGPLVVYEAYGIIQPFDGDLLHDKLDQAIFFIPLWRSVDNYVLLLLSSALII